MRNQPTPPNAIITALVVLLLGLVVVGAGCGALTGAKAWHRSQKRADANNQVKITAIRIRTAQQQAYIVRAQIAATKARAEQRYQESIGIRRAQDEISSTLTPLYVQHEAIQAQERMASTGRNNTSIYIPAGPNGVPLVRDTSKSEAKAVTP